MLRDLGLAASLLTAIVFSSFATAAHAADPAIKCQAGKLKEAGKYAACRFKADAKAATKGLEPDYAKCQDKFSGKWGATESKADGACPSNGDEATVDAQIVQCTEQIASGIAGPIPCAGADVGGACWFLGAGGASCDDACNSLGLTYDDATRTYAGSDGTHASCEGVLDALAVPADVFTSTLCTLPGGDIGCAYDSVEGNRFRCSEPTTTSTGTFSDWSRACACS
jgi:hypothetical protein